jgi:Mrp family chromosome partitioning ATPase
MTLDDLGAALRRFWPLALSIFGAILLIGLLAAFIPSERYRSQATVLLEPDAPDALAIAQAVEFVTPPVIEEVGSTAFADQIDQELGTPSASFQLSASNEPGTGILFVRAESTDPRITQDAANAAAQQVVEDPVSDLVTASVLSPAEAPASISGQRRAVLVFGSGVLGLIAAVLAAVGAQALRPRPSGGAFITDRYGVEVLGEIPFRRSLPKAAEISNGTGPPEVVEAFQKLAVNIELMAPSNPVIAITSWGQGEGKTMVTAQLARALALLKHEVTVIDCDLRRPTLHTHLGVGVSPGVAERAARGDRSVRQPTIYPSLDVIAAGEARVEHPAKTIAEVLPSILGELGDRIVLVDTPPLFGAETSMIATRADSVVLVVDARRSQPRDVRSALRDLELSNARVLGAVLNGTRRHGRRRGLAYYERSRQASLSRPS